jgi:hypothetical protein
MKYVFSAPVRIGDIIYALSEGGPEGLPVTEVGSKGCFVSQFDPPEQDLGLYFLYEDEGTEWFLNKEEAQKAYEATEA